MTIVRLCCSGVRWECAPFVKFLVRRYGGKRFIEFYFASRPGTFEADCLRVYGTDLENLEKAFWADAEQMAGNPLPRAP